MSQRAPIHLGSGEPVLLLHPFMMSQNVWKDVAPRLADTGRYEVFAPTMAGHNGGRKNRSWLLDSATLADDVERYLDELGWDTAHIVGNSLGGWVAFELERRGRARSLIGIAPAGGWHRWTLAKYEIVFKFVMGLPVWLTAKVLGSAAARLPGARAAASVPISATTDGISDADMLDIIDDVTHCPAYYQLLLKALLMPGLMELSETGIPTYLVVCEKDRVLPHPRFTAHFRKHLPDATRFTQLDGVGHIPMFEAPDRIAEVIRQFLDEQIGAPPQQAIG
ncbi:putative hydrolase or acyltransferase of alpha/beta superfamily [Mycolicibacterium chubuense NBB4]|uniref:Putative hydrolase or acyltransferase of alpha/beta superfamily n=1 Tax=Mycolicibacterium chubuense (strain NBB4) TaxID=710421 RepID=I4BFB2_MYCCN|nr:alpha/beta hydrolase [Mycolicibacterium chubuense]AFM15969.1 putative hydrolase or acyltransferase of alpha/beta superfamily [Mycolicibacterium chubuense NBB4]